MINDKFIILEELNNQQEQVDIIAYCDYWEERTVYSQRASKFLFKNSSSENEIK